ncbi:MAG TPA: phytanoyl-CoA dioxygenase family protein [Sporichthyaceae bacterium]
MTVEEILAAEPRVLTRAQQESYFSNGYLLVERAVPQEWLDRLRSVTREMVDRSRALARSDAIFDLEPGHTAENPRLRRLTSPVDQHPEYWEFASAADSPLPDIMADLVGPDVKFHHSKLNFKWAAGGEEVKWHQDISYWPHTNYSPLTAGLYLYDCGPDQGPLMVVPGSHNRELHSQYNERGEWAGCLSEADVKDARTETAAELEGPAGSITIHNCRVVHGSRPNLSDQGRPLLLNAFSAADAFTYTANPLNSSHAGAIVRGRPAQWARHDPRPCQIPPDWSGGYTSLFALQQGEQWEADQYSKGAR